jgi:hypothetical protein
VSTYLFAASVLFRNRTNFDYIPIALIALFLIALIASSVQTDWLSTSQLLPGRLGVRFTTFIHRLLQLCAVLLLAWMIGFGLYYVTDNRQHLSYAANFGDYDRRSRALVAMDCGQNAILGYYPGDPYIYYFTKMRPVSKYLFMWPWVAEFGQSDVLQALKAQPKAIVYFDDTGSVWGRPNKQFLGPLHEYISQQYIANGNNFYLSPPLEQACRNR